MTSESSTALSRTPAFEWGNHVGPVIGVAASALICLKLLAVAGWDSNTAFGILAANGTANVLTGALLAVLPTLYGAFAFAIIPRIERDLRLRTPVERAAARLLATWPTILLVFIVPLGILIFFAVFILLATALSIYRSIKDIRMRASRENVPVPTSEPPSRFEATSAGLAGLAILMFSSLPIPWIPPETVVTPNGEQTAYVLSRDEEDATVLFQEHRSLARIKSDELSGSYCRLDLGWWSEPLPRLFADVKYPSCPS
ncbi:hypothetical protein [Brachybacterium sacelli]|uniref:Uncharacterized protein n=1 Tax=Brachybacterium sacelli TaxID=173364 RepID=A0ABS4X321_9MICO|nr:hypothetical protein [Brachybacterium sacelli]MBP2382855.1 hypothetical protein [Brachybacterium sacelli]